MFYVTGPEAECYAGVPCTYVSPGTGAPTDVQWAAWEALRRADALVMLDGAENWQECMDEVYIAIGAGVPIIEEAIWHALTA